MRTAHYVVSTHWDREWYDSFQGFRMRLVPLLDEVLDTMEHGTAFRCFVMDGQFVPVRDYLEVRPEREAQIRALVSNGRLRIGPWYVLPDEWLVSGESLIRNLQRGMAAAGDLGGASSYAAVACDQFGHTGQLPQVFSQLGLGMALVWRGTNQVTASAHFNWVAPDGTRLPTFRFGRTGYCTFAFDVRAAHLPHVKRSIVEMVDALVKHTLAEAGRSRIDPILLFDGGDHLEIEPQIGEIIRIANERLAKHEIQIIHSDLDAYMTQVLDQASRIDRTIKGELRESGREKLQEDEQWLIPGVLSSRIHLKQRNAECEDELCLWSEPFSAFASLYIGAEYPASYLKLAWQHLLENHPHDSICGCSIDQVHQDMIYRFDQSIGISSRLTRQALQEIACASQPGGLPEGAMSIAVFNATAERIDEAIDLDIPFPKDWPTKFQEFFGYEEKPAFILRGPSGEEIPWQLLGQQQGCRSYSRQRRKFPSATADDVVSVAARFSVPAFGYTTLSVEPHNGATRHVLPATTPAGVIANEALEVRANPNGTIDLTDLRNGETYRQLLRFEDRADIGDGWYHGVAVNDQLSLGLINAQISVIAAGWAKQSLRIDATMRLPAEFDFGRMRRSTEQRDLRIISDITLRSGSDHLEIETTVHNVIKDHRLRVLFPTEARTTEYHSDSAFDVVKRNIAVAVDNNVRRELDVETRPQVTWTACGDDERGLAIVSRGLPESAVCDTPDRPIALTLLRSFRRAIFSNDNPGGQIQGQHRFRYLIVPFRGDVPINRLFALGQRVNASIRIQVLPKSTANVAGGQEHPTSMSLSASQSLFEINGRVVVTSIQHYPGGIAVRVFNPHNAEERVVLRTQCKDPAILPVTLASDADPRVALTAADGKHAVTIPAKRIATLLIVGSDERR